MSEQIGLVRILDDFFFVDMLMCIVHWCSLGILEYWFSGKNEELRQENIVKGL